MKRLIVSIIISLVFIIFPIHSAQAGLVGQGAPNETSFLAFWNAYIGKGSSSVVGSPINAVHRWGNGYIQDFRGGGTDTAIMLADGSYTAYVIWGAIWQKYVNLGGAPGFLGYPTTDEISITSSTGSQGVIQEFKGGRLTWHKNGSKANQTFTTYGGILAKYRAIGGEKHPIGLPITDELEAPRSIKSTNGRYTQFERGLIAWHRDGQRAGQSFEVRMGIYDLYKSLGGLKSWLGYPISDEYGISGGTRSDFERGCIIWTPQTGANAYDTNIPNLTVTSFSLNHSFPIASGSTVTATAKVKYNGSRKISVKTIGIPNYFVTGKSWKSFGAKYKLTFSPGETKTLKFKRVISDLGSYKAWLSMQVGDKWFEVLRSNGSSSFINYSTRLPNVKAPTFTFSPGTIYTGDNVVATALIRNNEVSPITLDVIGIPNFYTTGNTWRSFGSKKNVTIAPGQTINFNYSRNFDEEGNYRTWLSMRLGNDWFEVLRSNGSTSFINYPVYYDPENTEVEIPDNSSTSLDKIADWMDVYAIATWGIQGELPNPLWESVLDLSKVLGGKLLKLIEKHLNWVAKYVGRFFRYGVKFFFITEDTFRGLERMTRVMRNPKIPWQFTKGLAFQMERIRAYGLTNIKGIEIRGARGNWRFDFVLKDGRIIETKSWADETLKTYMNNGRLLNQIRNYASEGSVRLEFEGKRDQALIQWLKDMVKEYKTQGIIKNHIEIVDNL